MLRTQSVDVRLIQNKFVVPFDNAAILLILIENEADFSKSYFDPSERATMYNAFINSDLIPKFVFSNQYAATGDPELLKGCFQKGDTVDISPLVDVGFQYKAKVLFVEYIPEHQCNCKH